jgi:aspartate-semialdehyde dehydrogenase
MDPDVPLIVPEVNPEAISGYRKKNIIANPNCSTAQMVVALKPLHDYAKIRRVVVSTYQSVSGAGKAGMDELFEQSRNIFVGDANEPAHFTKQIAFNVIPHIDASSTTARPRKNGRWWSRPRRSWIPRSRSPRPASVCPCSSAIRIDQHRVRERDLGRQAQSILREAPGLMLVDKREDGGYVTPVECVGEYATYVSRVREDSTVDNGLSLWCVSDNLRKGAALNAVQIAELLGRKHLQKARLSPIPRQAVIALSFSACGGQ